MCGVRKCSNFILLHVAVVFPAPFIEEAVFAPLYILASFVKNKVPIESESEVAQLCPTLCDPKDCSLPGFSVHGIFQARILGWVAISFSRGSSQPKD